MIIYYMLKYNVFQIKAEAGCEGLTQPAQGSGYRCR